MIWMLAELLEWRESRWQDAGARAGVWGGLMDLGGFDDRGGVRVLVSVAEDFFRGEAERLLGRFDGVHLPRILAVLPC